MTENERGQGDDQHHAAGHEFLGFGQAHGENHQQQDHGYVRRERLRDHAQGAENQNGGKDGGHDDRDFAAGLQEADESPNFQQHKVDPKYDERF